MRKFLIFLCGILLSYNALTQYNYPSGSAADSLNSFRGLKKYEVPDFSCRFKNENPKNIILLIGDGMGVATVYAGMTANGGKLYINNAQYSGFSITYSENKYITDSGAGGSAISTGHKSKNGQIGMGEDDKPAKSILEYAEEKGLSTGLVSTSAITHATPASFIAHQNSRGSYEDIAADFLKTDIDVFIGGGYKYFAGRKDGADLTAALKNKGYYVTQNIEDVKQAKSAKIAALLAPGDMPRVSGRGDMLPVATENAVRLLSQNKKGFFVMIEGSQIDWGAHAKNMQYTIEEMLDFDQAVGRALKFAMEDGNTLVIVTADHETGGLTITGGDLQQNYVKGNFFSKDHTAVMVPVFAYGPGAENFSGIMQNTDIFKKMYTLLIEK